MKHEDIKIQYDTTLKDLRTDLRVQTILIIILALLSLVLCFKSWELATNYITLEQENRDLRLIVEGLNERD